MNEFMVSRNEEGVPAGMSRTAQALQKNIPAFLSTSRYSNQRPTMEGCTEFTLDAIVAEVLGLGCEWCEVQCGAKTFQATLEVLTPRQMDPTVSLVRGDRYRLIVNAKRFAKLSKSLGKPMQS
jgi:hypothetical protein